MANVLVTGGTGVLGRKLVADLLARGHAVRVLSRRTVPEVPEGATAVTGDLEADVGLAEALAGVETVVHSASDPRQRVDADVTGTDHLLRAARAAGEPHVLYVSIVGCDRIPIGYYRAKTVAELAVTESGLPWTVQRTTQFHDLVFALAYAVSRLPVVPVPRGVRVQPIDVRDLAPRIADLVEAGPAGRAPDLGGPEVHDLAEVVRMVQRAVGTVRPLLRLPLAGRAYRAFRSGLHLVPDHRTGHRTFAEYVAEHVHRAGTGATRVDVPYRWRS